MRSAAPRIRSRRRRVLFALSALLLVWLGLELVALVGFPLIVGTRWSPAGLHAERARLLEQDDGSDDARELANRTNWCLHPYLGYVLDPEDESIARSGAGMLPVGEWGFADDGPPFRKRGANELVIGIVGGSLAAMFADDGLATLARALREHPGLDDKRLVFVRLAVAGYRQPQQLIAVDLALAQGGEFDAIIDISGLNELAEPVLKAERNGVHPLFPSNWQFLAADTFDPALQRAIGGAAFVRETRRDLAGWFDSSWLRHSALCSLGWKLADRLLDSRAAAFNTLAQSSPEATQRYAVAGPRDELLDLDSQLDYGAEVWARCAEQLHKLCAANGIRSFHFLQPNQYVPDGKPLSADELAHAWHADHPSRRIVEQGFPRLQVRGDELAGRGVGYHDLTRVFAGVEETLYIDPCCHINRRGSELLALGIARIVGATLADQRPPLDRAGVRELRVAPDRARLDAPFATARAVVRGRLPDGEERDLGYACRDWSSSAPEVVTVDEYGRLTALRPGSARVTASFGARAIQLDVDVQFPALVELDNHSPRDDDPVLHARLTGEVIEAWLEPAPPAGLDNGWLMVGDAPYRTTFCRELLFADARTARMLPLTRSPDGVRWTVPLAPELAGRTIYLQCGIADPAQPCKLRSTNGLALSARR